MRRRPLGPARPGSLVAGIAVAGILLTGLATWATARADTTTEERLLETQTRQAASVLATLVTNIQQPMRAALDAQSVVPPDQAGAAFEQQFASYVGEEALFISASSWRQDDGRFERLVTLGVEPGLEPLGEPIQALLERAGRVSTSAVERVTVGDRVRIVYALADPDTGLVVYAERLIAANRRAPVDTDSAYADLHYAIYLGTDTSTEFMTTTDMQLSELPLTGLTASEQIPFGDNVLTLVTAPRHHLGSPLSQALPWVLLIVGLALTAAVALVARRLGRTRQQALSDNETITALYSQVDTLYAEQRALSVRLQKALLPQVLPHIPGVEVAVDYVASGQDMDIGGDWYSAIGLGDDSFAFVVGDVSGHGIDAVAEMARARFTLRAHLYDGASPAEALAKSSRQFDVSVDGHIVTALVGVGNWRTGQVKLCSAGHPRPVLLTTDGVELVEVPPSLPLGAGGSDYRDVTITMPPGSTLLGYTDGLIERRDEPIDLGTQRLLDTVRPVATTSASQVVEKVIGSLTGPRTRDDVAVLAVRRVPT